MIRATLVVKDDANDRLIVFDGEIEEFGVDTVTQAPEYYEGVETFRVPVPTRRVLRLNIGTKRPTVVAVPPT